MRQTTHGTCDEGKGTRVRRLREVSSREAAESLARALVPRGALTAGKFLEIGTDTLRSPVVEEGAARARRNPRTPPRRRGAVRAAVRSEDGPLERGLGKGQVEIAHRDLLGSPTQLPVASASRHQPGPRTVRVLRNLKEHGWNRR